MSSANSQNIDWHAFKKNAQKKVEDLNRYIQIITARPLNTDKANQAINLTLKLFVSKDKIVEVSTLNSEIKRSFRINEYFNNLKHLNYDRIEISQVRIVEVSSFILGPDGRYYASVVIRQKFEGYQDGILVYADETDKGIELVVDKFELPEGGTMKSFWDVYLGDISVKATRKIK